jgi:hypothetical protein
MKEPREREIAPTHFLPWHKKGLSGQHHAPAVLYPQEWTPGTHFIGGWVGPRAGLDTEDRKKSFAPARDQTPVVQSIVRHYTD